MMNSSTFFYIKAHTLDTEAPCLDLDLSVTNDIVSYQNYEKQDNFYFEIVSFLIFDGDVPHSPSHGVYILKLICFARFCSYVDEIQY